MSNVIQSAINKISDFWNTKSWFRFIVRTVIFPWGFWHLATKTPDRKINKREAEIMSCINHLQEDAKQNRYPNLNESLAAKRQSILEKNIGLVAMNRLTSQEIIHYANNDASTFDKPLDALQRNKIAFTCCMLTDDKLKKIINDENIPREYKEIAYCIGTMRKMLEQCTSEELFKALQNQQPPTYESIVKIKPKSNTDCHDAFLPTPKTRYQHPKAANNEQDLETTEPPFASKDELTYCCKEFWSENNAFNRALLQQMIAIELQSNPNHQKFYNNHQSEIKSTAKEAAYQFIMFIHS